MGCLKSGHEMKSIQLWCLAYQQKCCQSACQGQSRERALARQMG